MSYNLGEIDIDLLADGSYRTDGGAAFGIVPRAKWSKLVKPDREGRVPLAVNCYLIRTRRHNILVDAGIGNKLNDTIRETYAIKQDGALELELARVGVAPEEISGVILTHLHFDHAGGLTHYDDAGSLRITFPHAAHYVQRREWEEAIYPNERTRGSYQPEDFLPLKESGLLRFLDGDHYINPHISVIVTGGHTTAHQAVRVVSRGQVAYFPGDLIPAAPFVSPVYATAYDIHPLTTLEAKKTLLRRATRRGATVFLSHQTENAVGHVVLDEKGRYVYQPVRAPGEEPTEQTPNHAGEK